MITASQNLKWFQYFNPLHNIYPKRPPYNWTYLVIASYPGPISTSGPQRVSLTPLLHKNSSTIWRLQFCFNKISFHTSLVVQGLRLHIPTAGGMGLILGWWTKIPRPLLLLLLSHFSRVRLCATPQTAAHQAPPSLGFSRQKHWSGLPFPSPMNESGKWKWSHLVMSDS